MNRRDFLRRVAGLGAAAIAAPYIVPAPALGKEPGKPADQSKPVQVFILMGQSNMLGFGRVGPETKKGTLEYLVKTEHKYAHLVDDAGNWTERQDVRNVRVMNFKDYTNAWLTAAKSKHIGPELQFGYIMGHVLDEPVLVLKSCIGNRSLGWDLLPPGSERFTYEGKIYAGYKDTPGSWVEGEPKKEVNWYAGKQYDDDTASAKAVVKNLAKYYPGYKGQGYEVAGFVFWQGDKDRYNAAHASRYEQNLVQFIKQLRKDFNAPSAKFVCATLGQTKKGAGGNEGKILEAQLAVDGNSGKYPEFKGNVASVYSNPFCHGGASNSHYGGNAETYMDVGDAMGRAMAELLNQTKAGAAAARPVDDRKAKILEQNLTRRLTLAKNYLKSGNQTNARRILSDLAKKWPGTPQGQEAAQLLEAATGK